MEVRIADNAKSTEDHIVLLGPHEVGTLLLLHQNYMTMCHKDYRVNFLSYVIAKS